MRNGESLWAENAPARVAERTADPRLPSARVRGRPDDDRGVRYWGLEAPSKRSQRPDEIARVVDATGGIGRGVGERHGREHAILPRVKARNSMAEEQPGQQSEGEHYATEHSRKIVTNGKWPMTSGKLSRRFPTLPDGVRREAPVASSSSE